MTYQVIIPKTVEKQLNKLPGQVRETLIENLLTLQDNPRPANSLKLKNIQGYRLRVGNYRILYDIDDPTQTITLRRVGHRRDIYR
jgi:mRNA interferase RelE/StbE